MFEIMTSHFWAVAIVVSLLNGMIIYFRTKPSWKSNPELKEGYSKAVKHYVFWLTLPWIVMGICMELGNMDTIFEFFNPRGGNKYVLFWHYTVYGLWILHLCWLFMLGGVDFLHKHPGIFNKEGTSKPMIIFMNLGGYVGGIAGAWMMWTQWIPFENFPK